jgi:hypothetical protein
MTKVNTPVAHKFQMPRDDDAVGPQNEAERGLYKLVMEGINSGPSTTTSIAELSSELRVRIRSKR